MEGNNKSMSSRREEDVKNGMRALLRVPDDYCFKTAILISIFLTYICAISDYANITGIEYQPIKLSTAAFAKDIVFSLDILYGVDLMLSLINCTKRQLNRSTFVLIIEILAFIPYEVIYDTLGGNNVKVYYTFRLRYMLRFVRYIPFTAKQRHRLQTYSASTTVLSYIVVISLLAFTGACLRLRLKCWYMNNQVELISCENLSAFEYFLSFFITFGQLGQVSLIVEGTSFIGSGNVIAVLQFFLFILLYLISSMIICIDLDMNSDKFDFAILTDAILNENRAIKKTLKQNWTFQDEGYIKFLKKYLADYWNYWKYSHQSTISELDYGAQALPDIIHTEIMLEICWNMFKHSLLFKNESVHFLRHVALYANYVTKMEGEILYKYRQLRSELIYLVSGNLAVMCSENSESTLITFTGGTILGESTLFIPKIGITTIYCLTSCQFVTLSMKKFIRVKKVYPQIYAKLKKLVEARIGQAQRYDQIDRRYYEQGRVAFRKKHMSMKFIKHVMRKYLISNQNRTDMDIVDILSCDRVNQATMMRQSVFCTDYLTMYRVADNFDKAGITHFLQTGINFKINPNSTLISIWNMLIFVMIMLTCVAYPIGATLNSSTYAELYDTLMTIISILWLLDFASFLFIAKVDTETMHTDLEYIFRTSVQSATFWIDAICSFPTEFVINIFQGPLTPTTVKMLQINRLLKGYKLIVYFQGKQFFGSKALIIAYISKMIFSFFILTLVGYFIFYMKDYAIYIDKSSLGDANSHDSFLVMIVFILQFYESTSLMTFKLHQPIDMFPLIALQYFVLLWKLVIVTQVTAAVSLAYFPTIEYENLVEDIKRVFTLYNFDAKIRRKIVKYLYLHYTFGKGHYLLKSKKLVEFMGPSLYRMQRTISYKLFLENCPLFKDLSPSTIQNIAEIAQIMIIPKGELLGSAGASPREIYIIVKGKCAFTTPSNAIIKILNTGESLLLLELISDSKIVHNIITLTDCKLLCFNFDNLRHKFTKYRAIYELMNLISDSLGTEQLDKLQYPEMTITEDQEEILGSYKSYRNDYQNYMKGFKAYRSLRFFYLKFTFRSHGKLWFYWEISHLLLVYLSAFIGIIPVFINTGITSPSFWLLRFFDLTSLIDIYLRLHVMFYDDKMIEVTHPLATSLHYLKTSFIVDLLATFPFELIFTNPNRKIIRIVLPRLNRYLGFYRYIGMFKYLKAVYLSELKLLRLICFGFEILLLANLLVQCFIFAGCTLDQQNYLHCPDQLPTDYYWPQFMSIFVKVIKHLFLIGIFDGKSSFKLIYKLTLINVLGAFIASLFVAQITGLTLFRNSHLTTFQVKMQRLVAFMNMRKFDRNLRNEIIKYYEYIWMLREGKELGRTFQWFNTTTYEQILYTHDGPILQNSIIFKGFPNVVVKDLLSSSQLARERALIRGIILKVNDVQGNIFILLRGTVEVLGPDYSKLHNLNAGSCFGCLDKVALQRTTLIYVAKTHCEFMCIKSLAFHEIIHKYPAFYKHFSVLVRSSNFDYISCPYHSEEINEQLFNVTTFVHKMRVKQHKRNSGWILGRTLFKIHLPNEKFTLFISIYCFVAFMTECFQKIVHCYTIGMIIICYMLDLIFWWKIYLSFSTAYENVYGLLVVKRRLIALRYLRDYTQGFLFDMLCNFPFELVALFVYDQSRDWTWAYCRTNRLLKIVLVFRFVRSVRNRLNINVHLIRGLYIMLLVVTLQQISMMCLTQGLINIDANTTYFGAFLNALGIQVYLMSLGTFVPSDLSIVIDIHTYYYKIIYMLLILVTRIIIIYVYAECVSSYQILYYCKFSYIRFMRKVLVNLHSKSVSQPFIKRVSQYFENLGASGRSVQFPSFLKEAPFYLREGVLDSMFGFHLRQHAVFAKCHMDLLRQIAATFETLYLFQGDYITFRNHIDCTMYFIHDGVVECLSKDNLYFDVVDKTLQRGDSFGFEQIMYSNCGHVYTYRVAEDATMLVLKQKSVLPLLDFFPASKHLIYSNIYKQEDTN